MPQGLSSPDVDMENVWVSLKNKAFELLPFK